MYAQLRLTALVSRSCFKFGDYVDKDITYTTMFYTLTLTYKLTVIAYKNETLRPKKRV
jgi:hypothetical protein